MVKTRKFGANILKIIITIYISLQNLFANPIPIISREKNYPITQVMIV
jgi:hypothetical protein